MRQGESRERGQEADAEGETEGPLGRNRAAAGLGDGMGGGKGQSTRLATGSACDTGPVKGCLLPLCQSKGFWSIPASTYGAARVEPFELGGSRSRER